MMYNPQWQEIRIAPEDREKLLERIMKKVIVMGPDECWPWTGRTLKKYGRVEYKGKEYMVHRIGFVLLKGELDTRTIVHHTCEYKVCMNPEHWKPVTSSQHQIIHRGV